MAGVPYTFATASTTLPLQQLDTNFQTPITIGNTSVALGNAITTIGNLTLTNVTVTSGNVTANIVSNNVSITGGTISNVSLTGNFVTQIVAGTNINVSPANGVGIVTINSTGSSGTGAVANGSIYISNTIITTSYTFANNTGGMSVGPVTITGGNSINVAANARWVIL